MVSSNETSENILREMNDSKAELYIPVIVYLIIMMIFGILGNSLVLIVYLQKTTKSSSHLFIVTLALLDLFSCCVGIPTEIFDLRNPYMFNSPVACKLLRFSLSATSIGSAIVLVEVAFDRYFRICKIGKQFSTQKTKILCIFSLFIGIALSWPSCIIFGKKTIYLKSDIKGSDCSTADNIRSVYSLLYYGFLFLLFVVCTTIITVLYVRLGLEIYKRKKIQRRSRNNSMVSSPIAKSPPQQAELSTECSENTSKRSISYLSKSRGTSIRVGRTTSVLIVVSAIFVMSFLPFLIVMVIRSTKKGFESSLSPAWELVYKFCVKSYFLNNASNPLIYSFFNAGFRKDVPHSIRKLVPRCGQQ